MTDTAFTAIVLAAGKGTRMKSRLPKVLHQVAGLSMVCHVLHALSDARANEAILVTSPEQDEVRSVIAELEGGVRSAVQERQLGTADAVKAARGVIDSKQSPVIVLCGDTPLMRASTIASAVDHARQTADVTVLGFRAKNPTGYGRLLLDASGNLTAIREEADASADERMIDLCNSGVIAFGKAEHLDLLDEIGNDNAKGEFYLTDIIEVAGPMGCPPVSLNVPKKRRSVSIPEPSLRKLSRYFSNGFALQRWMAVQRSLPPIPFFFARTPKSVRMSPSNPMSLSVRASRSPTAP